MGAEGSKSAKPPSDSGIRPDKIIVENELPFEKTHHLPANNLANLAPTNSSGLQKSLTDSIGHNDFGVLNIGQLNTSEKSNSNVHIVEKDSAITPTPIGVEQGQVNFDGNESNLPLIHENWHSNIPLLNDSCVCESSHILNESKSEPPLLFDNKARSSSPFPANSLLDTNKSQPVHLDHFQHAECNDNERLHEAVKISTSDDLHKSVVNTELFTEASTSVLTKSNTDETSLAFEAICSNLEDFTLTSTKKADAEEIKNESKFLSSTFFKDECDFKHKFNQKSEFKRCLNKPKCALKVKRNIKATKNTVVPESLKEVEKVANRLCSYTAIENKTSFDVLSSRHEPALSPKPLQLNSEFSVIPQQLILDNLQYMTKFISELKSGLILDEKVLFSLKSLKREISSLILLGHNVPDDQDLHLAFKLLLDSLPDHLQKEKDKVVFKNGVPICNICKQRLSRNFLDAIKHLESANHNKHVNNFEGKFQYFNLPSACKDESNGKNILFQSENNTSKNESTLQKKHEGLLEIIYESKMNNFDVNVPLYICVSCDYWTNDEKLANVHLTDKAHTVQSNADWCFCSSCSLNIYGTTEAFKEHCSSLMHNQIFRLIDENNQNRMKKEKDIEISNVKEIKMSGCSSSSSLNSRLESKPRPIDRVTCTKISDESSSEESLENSESTSPSLKELSQEENLAILRNGTGVSVEEVADKGRINRISDESSDQNKPCSNESFCSEGPHYDLMKGVLKKHLLKQQKSDYFGFYCHVCKALSEDEKLWLVHLTRPSHCNRMDSLNNLEKNMTICDCRTCNIQMICDDEFYKWHKQSIPHRAIENSNIKTQTNLSDHTKQEVPKEDGKEATPSNLVRNGIRLKGLQPSFKEAEVVNYFKRFGFIKSCTLDQTNGTGNVVFEKKINATMVLEIRFFIINNVKVEATALYGNNQALPKKKKAPSKLTYKTVEVLMSQNALNAKVTGLMTELSSEKNHKERQAQLIGRDLYKLLPGCKVHFFGSFITGLATKDSDFDIYIDFDKRSFFRELHPEEQMFNLQKLSQLLQRQSSGFSLKESALGARVPIIRAQHKESNTPCDISCRNGLSVENSHLIKVYLCSDVRVHELVSVIKWWMRENDLLGSNLFTSYATTWLVFFFLMNLPKPVLCPVTKLQHNCKAYPIASWDCRFSRDIERCFKTSNDQTLPQLLVQFFRFYKNFSFFDVVLCPLNAMAMDRKLFNVLDLPPVFNPYVYKMQNHRHAEAIRLNTPICLQDPFDLSHNITKGVFGKDLKKFKQLCEHSEQVLRKEIST